MLASPADKTVISDADDVLVLVKGKVKESRASSENSSPLCVLSRQEDGREGEGEREAGVADALATYGRKSLESRGRSESYVGQAERTTCRNR